MHPSQTGRQVQKHRHHRLLWEEGASVAHGFDRRCQAAHLNQLARYTHGLAHFLRWAKRCELRKRWRKREKARESGGLMRERGARTAHSSMATTRFPSWMNVSRCFTMLGWFSKAVKYDSATMCDVEFDLGTCGRPLPIRPSHIVQ
jgi:hypothetical protein